MASDAFRKFMDSPRTTFVIFLGMLVVAFVFGASLGHDAGIAEGISSCICSLSNITI